MDHDHYFQTQQLLKQCYQQATQAKHVGQHLEAATHALAFLKHALDRTMLECLASSLYAMGSFSTVQQVANYGLVFFPFSACFRQILSPKESHPKEALNPIHHDVMAMFSPPETPPTVSICMIVKNEEDVILKCLESIRDIADELIVVDTGSTDQTPQLVRQFSERAKLIEFPWNDNFSEARNISLEHATGDWIMVIDADETLHPKSLPVLKQMFQYKSLGRTGFSVNIYSFSERSENNTSEYVTRIFSNHSTIRFSGMIHEQLYITDGSMRLVKNHLPQVQFLHSGYQNERIETQKKSRRFHLLKASISHPDYNNPYMGYHYAGFLVYPKQNYEKARMELEQCIGDTLAHMVHPPSPTWFGAPLHQSILLLNRVWNLLGRQQEISTHFIQYIPYCPDSEYWLIYGNSLLVSDRYQEAKTALYRCFDPQNDTVRSDAGFSTWQPLALLLSLSLKENDMAAATSYCLQLLSHFPRGQLPLQQSLPNLNQLLANLLKQQHMDQETFYHRFSAQIQKAHGQHPVIWGAVLLLPIYQDLQVVARLVSSLCALGFPELAQMIDAYYQNNEKVEYSELVNAPGLPISMYRLLQIVTFPRSIFY